MPKVLICDALSPAVVEAFEGRGIEVDYKAGISSEELLATVKDYDGLAVRSATRITAEIIAASRNLRVVGRAGIGVDNIDVAAATANGIVVMNTPFGNSITTAEHTIAMMFAAARQIPRADASTQDGRWEKNRFVGAELYGKTLGLVGCGNIGSIVANRALGLKMTVIAYDPFLTAERAIDLGVEPVSLDELLARSDVVSLHVPMTESTRKILSAEKLARTKPGVIVVNVARGGLVDEDALRELLDNGHVFAAAFDVFGLEPAYENVLFGAQNFVATPHLGASTVEAQVNVARHIAGQMSDFLLTGAVTNALNMPSISAEEAPRLKPYVELAEKLGSFAGQLVDEALEEIEIEFEGNLSELNIKPLVCSALAGVLRPQLQDVNMVSAPAIVRERGISLTESKRKESPIYDSLIRIKVRTPGSLHEIAGALLAGAPKLVEVKGMSLEADFNAVMLYTNNDDKPGFIGALGTILGNAGINIGTLTLGRNRERKEAVAIVGVDDLVPDAIIEELRALPQVSYVRLLVFQ